MIEEDSRLIWDSASEGEEVRAGVGTGAGAGAGAARLRVETFLIVAVVLGIDVVICLRADLVRGGLGGVCPVASCVEM